MRFCSLCFTALVYIPSTIIIHVPFQRRTFDQAILAFLLVASTLVNFRI